jgi:hypothetical protein
MSYSDKTYIIFDGDNDKWAYGRMKGWKALENVDFETVPVGEISRKMGTSKTAFYNWKKKYGSYAQLYSFPPLRLVYITFPGVRIFIPQNKQK